MEQQDYWKKKLKIKQKKRSCINKMFWGWLKI